MCIDPPGPSQYGRWSLFSHMVSVRPSGKQKTRYNTKIKLKHLATLYGAWWITKFTKLFDPLGHGRIGGHYVHTWCPSVCTSVTKNKNAIQRTPCVKIMTSYWLAPDWSLNSQDLFLFLCRNYLLYGRLRRARPGGTPPVGSTMKYAHSYWAPLKVYSSIYWALQTYCQKQRDRTLILITVPSG